MMLTSGCQDDNLTENLQFVHSEPNVRLADPLGSFCSIIYGSWAKVRKCTVGTSLETLSLPAVWRCYDRYYFTFTLSLTICLFALFCYCLFTFLSLCPLPFCPLAFLSCCLFFFLPFVHFVISSFGCFVSFSLSLSF